MFALINGKIITMTRAGVIEEGIIVVDEGKIIDVGRKIAVPSEAETIDVKNSFVIPGLVDAHTHIGGRAEANDPPGDGAEWTSPLTPEVAIIDSVNPLDGAMGDAAKAGVTTILCVPASGNVIGGTAAALKTWGKTLDDITLWNPAALKVAFGEVISNPNSKIPFPVTRMGVAAMFRNALQKTKQYMQRKSEKHASNEEFDIGFEHLAMVLRREIPVHLHVYDTYDIMTFARIAHEFEIEWYIAHGHQAHLVSEELVKKGVGVIFGPLLMPNTLQPDTAIQLQNSGVQVALHSDGPNVFPTNYLILQAAIVAKAGLDWWEALKMITINPAEIIGVADRVGSIEKGKDADIVVLSDHPFKWRSKVERVFIDGMEVEAFD